MSDILSRLAERAQGSPVCLAHRVRYRFAPLDPNLEGWPEAGGGDALAGPLEAAAGDEPAAQRGLDRTAAPAPEAAVPSQTGRHTSGSSAAPPEPLSEPLTEPPVALEASASRRASSAPIRVRGKPPAGAMPPPESDGFAAAAPPPSAPTVRSPVVQRVARAATSREAAEPAVDSGKLSAGAMPRPKIDGGAAAAPPPLPPAARSPAAQRVAKARMSRETTSSPVEGEKPSTGATSPPQVDSGAAAIPPRLAPTARSPVAQRVAKAGVSPETAASPVESERLSAGATSLPQIEGGTAAAPPSTAPTARSPVAQGVAKAGVSREAAASPVGSEKRSAGATSRPQIEGGAAAAPPSAAPTARSPVTQRVAKAGMSRETSSSPDGSEKFSPPEIRGGDAAASPPSSPATRPPVAQRVAKPATSREMAASPVDAGEPGPAAAPARGRPEAQRKSPIAALPGGRPSITMVRIGAEQRTTPAAIGASSSAPVETGRHQEKSAAAQPMRRLHAGTSPQTMPRAATPDGSMRAPVAQLRADPALAPTATATAARAGPVHQVGAFAPTPAAAPASPAERSNRSSIGRTDRSFAPPQRIRSRPARLEAGTPPTPGTVEVLSPRRPVVPDQAADRPASPRTDAEQPDPTARLAVRQLPPPSERMLGHPAPSRLAALRPVAESDDPALQSVSGSRRGRAPESQPAPAPVAPEIRIDIGRIQIELPRAPTHRAPRPRPEPPPLQGKPRGGPER